MKLIVLLSTYNGEKYLKEQLNSLISQDLKSDKILIRDDGSSDSTLEIIKYYADNYSFIEYYQGENLGPAKSFFELINKAKGYDYYSLCDQDDVWFKDKLKVAISNLNKYRNENIPLLYASKFTMTDENLNPLDAKISELYNYHDFAHALLYTSAPGCTMVFNNAAREKIIKYDINKEYLIIHDSIIHKVVTMFGKMILDEKSYMYYRQHSNNQIGLPTTKYQQFVLRIKRFFKKENTNIRSDLAKSLLNVYGNEITSDKRELLEIVANYRENKKCKKKLLTLKEFKTGTINDLFFMILVLTNYI